MFESDSEKTSSEEASVLFQGSLKSSSSSVEDVSLENYVQEVSVENLKKTLFDDGLYDPGSGEICTKYLTLSRSSVIGHPFYNYPCIKDPGIVAALLETRADKEYESDGQELYLYVCEKMNTAPIRIFYRGLLNEVIDLRYYGVSPKGVRAMCLALAYNQHVQRLDLTGNFLNDDDACFHLGQMLHDRNVLQDLVLAGCKIGHKGLLKLVEYLDTRKMNVLDLSGNDIQDKGFTYLADKLDNGAYISQLNLNNNNLSCESAKLMAEVLDYNKTITHLDLSRNPFVVPKGYNMLLRQLAQSNVLQSLNLAWTSLKATTDLAPLFYLETLRTLNLSHNKLPSAAATIIAKHLQFAIHLRTLDLSSNPLKPNDALLLMRKLKLKRIRLQELFMDNIVVEKIFAEELANLMKMPHRRRSKITHGEVLHNYETKPLANIKILTLKRFAVVTTKKNKPDVLVYILGQAKTRSHIDPNELVGAIRSMGLPISEDIIESLLKYFPGPKTGKDKKSTINLEAITEYIRRLWPEKRAPPTPPPEKETSVERKPRKKKNAKKVKKIKKAA